MSRPRIGIIGSARERQCAYLGRLLEGAGGEPVHIETVPETPSPLSLLLEPRSREGVAKTLHRRGELEDVDVFYFRMVLGFDPLLELVPDPAERRSRAEYAAERERRNLWYAWLALLEREGRFLVNPPSAGHPSKVYQATVLAAAGVPVPASLATSDPELLVEFAAGREVVYKPLNGGAYCRKLTEDDLCPERLRALTRAPVLFQEYVPGVDVRVFVVGEDVPVAIRIEAEGLDYRAHPAVCRPIPLPREVEEWSLESARLLGLRFTGIDWRLTPGGDWVLLECNSSPMFEGFDAETGGRIGQALAGYLLARAKEGCPHAA